MQSCFNVEQLEDVDMVNEDDDADALLQRIDGGTLQCVVKVSLSFLGSYLNLLLFFKSYHCL